MMTTMSSLWETATFVQGYRAECQDRVAVIELEERTVIVVADGAGGSGDGSAAADVVIREIKQNAAACNTAAAWKELLTAIDFRIGSGEATAVVVDLQPAGICGASVGDSRAWILGKDINGPEEIIDLTAGQQRKPLLGSGSAVAVGFEQGALDGTLVVATDGLFNYLKRPLVLPLLARVSLAELPRALAELVRLPSGDWWDDIGIIACRRRVTPRTRRRYVID
jgi:serine/threonine protein phosphatase PrpC